jgi:hypothetical protein
MDPIDAFIQVEQIVPTKFEHENRWLVLKKVTKVNQSTCNISGVISTQNVVNQPAPDDLLVNGTITVGNGASGSGGFNIAFTATPNVFQPNGVGTRQYTGAIQPIEPFQSPGLYHHFFLAGSYSVHTWMSSGIFGFLTWLGPIPFTVTLPTAGP